MTQRTSYLESILGKNEEARMALREIPLLKNCSSGLQQLIFQYGRLFKLRKGESLAKEGEFDQWVYFIITGRLGVFVGDDWVDTISSSLVGERCIFGEPRGVTLKAELEEVIAIGVDMSLLDVLKGGGNKKIDNLDIYIELISIITAEILKRIAEFEYNIFDISNKYSYFIKAEELSLITYNLKNNQYSNDISISRVILDFLVSESGQDYDSSNINSTIKVNTRKLYSKCISTGRRDVIDRLTEKIQLHMGKDRNIVPIRKIKEEEILSYSQFVEHLSTLLKTQFDKTQYKKIKNPFPIEAVLKDHFTLNDDLTVDLSGFCAWMESLKILSGKEIINVLLIVLQEASKYTASINKQLNTMMTELDRMKSKRLESASSSLHVNVQEYYGNKSPDEMISFFGKQILETFIIDPCLKFLKMEDEPETIISESEINESQKIIDTLFD